MGTEDDVPEEGEKEKPAPPEEEHSGEDADAGALPEGLQAFLGGRTRPVRPTTARDFTLHWVFLSDGKPTAHVALKFSQLPRSLPMAFVSILRGQ